MVKRTHLLVAIMASVVAGALVSASVTQLAQVAYSGMNPGAAQGVSRTNTTEYRNSRSIQNETIHGTSAEIPGVRSADDQPADSRHEPASITPVPDYCAGTSHQRRTRCLIQYLNGVLYRLNGN
ncbi:MAG: hypothetical protein PHE68_00120 [Candidatus Peribacteraceae bacterium]|nr:hypothetical protein [Candidatus Peribacteraceae bacterium]MDD5075241.1 hypothetical protein [Candidatus Peribacteraceae bacterium]